jgi:tRNA modification GTPase
MRNTIFALASAPGRSGVAIVRISGPQAFRALQELSRRVDFLPRQCVVCSFYEEESDSSVCDGGNPTGRDLIDAGMAVYFEGPASFTGEDVVELFPHGSPAVIRALIERLGQIEGLRMAEPGEFTRRAFENGKLDLTAAEAVGDLIHAETQLQRQQALAQMNGVLSSLYDGWTERLKRALAHIEADIEFPDEDLPEGVMPEIIPVIEQLQQEIAAHLADGHRGERLRDGLHVAVIGAPNVGKSSLVNALAQRDVAIVSEMAGTTRDVIEAHLDLGGYPIILADTAGLRPEELTSESGHDRVESEGIRRALKRAESADIRLLVFDGTQDDADEHTLALVDEVAIVVINKCEGIDSESVRLVLPEFVEACSVRVSAKTGKGFENLIALLTQRAEGLIGMREAPSLTRERHRTALAEAMSCLSSAMSAVMPELVAEDVRLAVRAIGRVTGRVDVEDLLDVIFRDFCIGK